MSPHFKDEAWGGADLCLRIDDGVMGGILEPKLIIPPLTPLLSHLEGVTRPAPHLSPQ